MKVRLNFFPHAIYLNSCKTFFYFFRKLQQPYLESSIITPQDKESSSSEIYLKNESNENQTYNLEQPIYLNEIPVIQNEQLVYQVQAVQNINNLNFTNGNSQQNFVYIVIPTTNEKVQIDTVPVELLKNDKQNVFDMTTYEKSGYSDVKQETDVGIVTNTNKFLLNEPEQDPLQVSFKIILTRFLKYSGT